MVVSGKVQKAFNVDEESAATRAAYGSESIGQKALLARRLVEAGVTFVLVSGAWGYFDHHGDNVRWFGIEKGLKPLMPRVDRTLHSLVTDLEQRKEPEKLEEPIKRDIIPKPQTVVDEEIQTDQTPIQRLACFDII